MDTGKDGHGQERRRAGRDAEEVSETNHPSESTTCMIRFAVPSP